MCMSHFHYCAGFRNFVRWTVAFMSDKLIIQLLEEVTTPAFYILWRVRKIAKSIY